MNVNDIEKIARDLTLYVTDIAKQYGPKAWDVVCNVKRAESIGELLWGLCWVIMFCVSMYFAGVMRRWYKKQTAEEEKKERTEKQKENDINEDMTCIMTYGVYLIVSIAFFGSNMCGYIFNIWNWIGVFDPGIAIAHDVMQQALNNH